MATSNKLSESVKMLIGGVLAIVAASWFWQSLVGNPLHELALIQRGQVAPGALVDTYEDEQEDYRGHVYFSDIGIYVFSVPGGREFKAHTREPTGRLRDRCEVEYLADDPSINRVRGDGSRTLFDWTWRKVGLGGALFAMFVSPGVVLMRDAIRSIRKIKETAVTRPVG